MEEQHKQEYFPDGTPIAPWFYETEIPTLEQLGKPYCLTDYGITEDGKIHTAQIQALIDKIAAQGGGVLVVPEGTYRTGALHFRQGVNLYLAQGGTLLGSDDLSDYELTETRMEGEICTYFTALINAEGLDGFTIAGPGTIDGNGQRAWKAFWMRRRWNPACTNKDEQRPRLVFLTRCSNVRIAQVTLQNSHYWTTHLYRCDHVKYLGCRIFSPAAPVPAPSTDAIDIDFCTDVLVKNCYLEVNDDSVVIKGGRGPWADTQPGNGISERILVEDCHYGFCHGCLTCGSESVGCKNVLIRRLRVDKALNLLWLKMRPDTPQHYQYIRMEDVTGEIESFLNIKPWTQFYDLKDRKDIPLSYGDHIAVENCTCVCDAAFDIDPEPTQYQLRDFTFKNLTLQANTRLAPPDFMENTVYEACSVTPR